MEELVAAIERTWNCGTKVKASRSYRGAIAEFAWLRELGLLYPGFTDELLLPKGILVWVALLPDNQLILRLKDFAWNKAEAKQYHINRQVTPYNTVMMQHDGSELMGRRSP
ncbi:MAG: hypothetical protein ACI841_004655 [Planctomycetota bacterium]